MDEGGKRCELVIESTKFVDIQILLVDDDATSLAVVSTMLRVCKYQVVTLKNPMEALDTLRAKKGFFDLVVTDLHMPQMNGLQLQKQVMQEFKLPVIMMSADEKPSVILKSLEEGVAFYMVKPISLDDVKHLWQYAITAKKTTPKQTRPIIRRELSIDVEKSSFQESSSSMPCSKEEIKSKSTKSKKKKAKENRVDKKSIAIRKPKVIWTNSLHNRFLQAIRLIGLDKAVPKKILEFMNVAGLTRENVASHLQKYRIFLKRVAEKGACSMKIYSDYSLIRSNLSTHDHHFQISQHPNFPPHQNQQLIMPPFLNYQSSSTLGSINLSNLTLPNPNLEGASSMKNSLAYLDNLKYSSLLTINKPNNFPFNEIASSSTRDDENLAPRGKGNPRWSTGEDRVLGTGGNGVCNNDNVLAASCHDDVRNKEGLRLDGGCTNEDLEMVVCKTNNCVEKNGSVRIISEEEEEEGNVNIWKEANYEAIAFGDIIGEQQQNSFDVLSEIFMDPNYNQPSNLQKEEIDISDIWKGIEIDASPKEIDLQPSGFSAQGWDDDLFEMFFGDGSS